MTQKGHITRNEIDRYGFPAGVSSVSNAGGEGRPKRPRLNFEGGRKMGKNDDRRIVVTVPLEQDVKEALEARADANDRAVGREAAVIIKAALRDGAAA